MLSLQAALPRIGPSLAGDASKVIDAEGLAVTPGFIDIKTHSDFVLPINPKAESKVRQGVTTEIIGHCGFSVAPVLPGKTQLLADYLSGGAPWLPFREMGFSEYLDTFPAVAVNAGMLVGHNTLRLMVMGLEDRAPTKTELEQMIALLEDGLRAGALGMSSGLFTPPGSFAKPDEMMALCAVLKRHNAAYFTHIRDEANRVMEAVDEAIDIARACGIHVQIVHLKCSGVDNWGKAEQVLDKIAAARSEGCDIDCDAYPYAAGANPLKNLLPPWVQIGGNEAMLARLRLPETRARIRAELADHGLNNWGRIPSWEAVQISISPRRPETAGQTVAALARAQSCDPIDQICDHLIADNGATRVLITSISEDDIRTIVRSPTALVGSDGNCVATYGVVSQGTAASPVLRHLSENHRALRPRRTADPARAGGLQDDRRPGEGAQIARPRPIEGRLPRRHCYFRSKRFSGRGDLRRTRIVTRAAGGRPSSSTAPSSSRMRLTLARRQAACCAAPLMAASASVPMIGADCGGTPS